MYRIGQGFDFHRFSTQGDHLILGGVKIPFAGSLMAHSDGDILLHALMDALLGALGLPDIGHFFPDTDSLFKDISSVKLLNDVLAKLDQANYTLCNADITIISEIPKMGPHREVILENLSRLLKTEPNRLSLKATTVEKMGAIGAKEGMACSAVVLLRQKEPSPAPLKSTSKTNANITRKSDSVLVFTDGACSGNPGPGGWGALIQSPKGEQELSGGELSTTNNRMELEAVIQALRFLIQEGIDQAELYTDSQYVKNGITQWVHNWKTNQWKTAAKKPVLNQDLWQTLDELNQKLQISFHWLKGHAGHPENERCDALARAEIIKLHNS